MSVGLGAELAQEPQHADAPPEATPQPGTKGFSMFFFIAFGERNIRFIRAIRGRLFSSALPRLLRPLAATSRCPAHPS